jgi:hypothetical protein
MRLRHSIPKTDYPTRISLHYPMRRASSSPSRHSPLAIFRSLSFQPLTNCTVSQPLCFHTHTSLPGGTPLSSYHSSDHPMRMGVLSERSELRILHPEWFYGTKDLSSPPASLVTAHPLPSSRVPYTLPSSVCSKSFACHSYENCRGGGTTVLTNLQPLLELELATLAPRIRRSRVRGLVRVSRFDFRVLIFQIRPSNRLHRSPLTNREPLSPSESALTPCDAVTPLDSALTQNCRVAVRAMGAKIKLLLELPPSSSASRSAAPGDSSEFQGAPATDHGFQVHESPTAIHASPVSSFPWNLQLRTYYFPVSGGGRRGRWRCPCGGVHPGSTFCGALPILRCLRGFLFSAR